MNRLLDTELAAQWVAPLADALRARGWRMATAESCTGGLIAATCTALAGSSDWFERGFVTYSNAAKTEQLGVDPTLIAQHGAVSEPVVRAMAEGALAHSPADIALAVTGIAGPGGATPGWSGWRSRSAARPRRPSACNSTATAPRFASRPWWRRWRADCDWPQPSSDHADSRHRTRA